MIKIDATIRVHLTDPRVSRILELLSRVEQQEIAQMADLSQLKAQVERTTSLEQSAIQLIQGLAAQLQAAATDPQAIQDLANTLQQQADSLAQAVAANTPADQGGGSTGGTSPQA